MDFTKGMAKDKGKGKDRDEDRDLDMVIEIFLQRDLPRGWETERGIRLCPLPFSIV